MLNPAHTGGAGHPGNRDGDKTLAVSFAHSETSDLLISPLSLLFYTPLPYINQDLPPAASLHHPLQTGPLAQGQDAAHQLSVAADRRVLADLVLRLT